MHTILRTAPRLINCPCALYRIFKNFSSYNKEVYKLTTQKKLHCPNYNGKCMVTRLYCSSKNEDSLTEENPVDVEAIASGNEEIAHKLKVILLEMEVMRQEGRCVPPNDYMKSHHWQELLKLKSFSARRKYFDFLFKTYMKKQNQKAKREEAKVKRLEKLKERPMAKTFEEFVTTYDLQHNNIFLRFYETSINQMYNNRLIQAIQFGQKIVVDCGYHEQMTRRENINCAKQMMLLFSENRMHEDPYDVHFCNANPEGPLIEAFHKHIPTLYEPWFPINIHQESYLNIFPKDQLVYLTPDCREELTKYDHEAIYIIGAIVDKFNHEPLSLAKAKRERLRMAKLPLDRYLQWGAGSGKSLTLNQMIAILLDVKKTGDWEFALRHVPRRKLVDEEVKPLSYSKGSQMHSHGRSSTWTPSFNASLENSNKSSHMHSHGRSSTWTPSSNTNLENSNSSTQLKPYNQLNKDMYAKAREKRKRLTNVKNIIYDE